MKEFIKSIEPRIMEIFHHLHSHAEISWQEYQTTEYLTQLLESEGVRVKTFDDHTGLIGEMGNGKPVVALRADIDALWQEVNGTFQANHSCGHDAHMTMALGVLFVLKKFYPKPNGTIRFIFQPAEEKGTGALKMVEKGVVDDVSYLYGMHLRPFQEIPDGTAVPSILHGGARFVSGKIKSDDAHGARPHLGQNAIEIGANFVSFLNSIHIDPMQSYSAKMTAFQAGGESSNIIPGSATFSLDLRAQNNDTMEELQKKVDGIGQHLANYYGVDLSLEIDASVAAAEVSLEAQEKMKASIIDVLGEEKCYSPLVTTGGDDFHFYTIKRPHLKATMLGIGCDLAPGLHHPDMTFNHKAMLTGIEILAKTIIKTVEGKGTA